jgi:hypothetical protein
MRMNLPQTKWLDFIRKTRAASVPEKVLPASVFIPGKLEVQQSPEITIKVQDAMLCTAFYNNYM